MPTTNPAHLAALLIAGSFIFLGITQAQAGSRALRRGRGSPAQCAISTGSVMPFRMLRVTPPRIISRTGPWP